MFPKSYLTYFNPLQIHSKYETSNCIHVSYSSIFCECHSCQKVSEVLTHGHIFCAHTQDAGTPTWTHIECKSRKIENLRQICITKQLRFGFRSTNKIGPSMLIYFFAPLAGTDRVGADDKCAQISKGFFASSLSLEVYFTNSICLPTTFERQINKSWKFDWSKINKRMTQLFFSRWLLIVF